MASSKGFIEFIMDQFSELGGVSYRFMMGDYILYFCEKVVGGVFDDRLMVKPVSSAIAYFQEPKYDTPFPGAKEWLLVEDVDNREFLQGLLLAMFDELPYPKPKKKKEKKA